MMTGSLKNPQDFSKRLSKANCYLTHVLFLTTTPASNPSSRCITIITIGKRFIHFVTQYFAQKTGPAVLHFNLPFSKHIYLFQITTRCKYLGRGGKFSQLAKFTSPPQDSGKTAMPNPSRQSFFAF